MGAMIVLSNQKLGIRSASPVFFSLKVGRLSDLDGLESTESIGDYFELPSE
jgi:hypothetical protein